MKSWCLIITIFALSSCGPKSKSIRTKDGLIGTWKLDSVSNVNGKYYKADAKNIFTFKDASNYTYEWMNYDVGNTFNGKYAVIENPKRAWATITLVPDVQINDKDTIRIEYNNFDIIELSTNRLHTVAQTEFINRKGKPSIIFNKHKIYKRVVSR
jgi:hypothetical protein